MNEPKIILTKPVSGEVVSLLTKTQADYIANEAYRAQIPGGESFEWDKIRRQGEDFTQPEPVIFRWEGFNGNAVLELSKTADFTDIARVAGLPDIPANHVRHIGVQNGEAAVSNLEAGQVYFWRIRSGNLVSAVETFSTSDEVPRWIHLDGCSNVRDLGGWKTIDGRRIRQGYLYRTGEFDTHMNLTAEGIDTALHTLGIRTDLDQRGEAVGKVIDGVLEPYRVRRVLLPMQGYDFIFEDSVYRKNLAHGFRLITNPASWPLCFHCWGGADRGGTLALLVEGVLGVPREQLVLDYELTSLSIWGVRTRNYEPFDNMMKRLDGFSSPDLPIRDNIEAFLVSIGVPKEEIDRLRNALLV